MSTVVIVRTGTANTASVKAAFERLGFEVESTQDADRIRTAEHLVLPGVGAFGAAMDELDQRGLREALRERALGGRPMLAICVGMQLLCARSSESPGAIGLGVIDGEVARFEGSIRVPQLGWNDVAAPADAKLVRSGVAYFANSYRLAAAPGWVASTTDYGGPFVAAMERGGLLACQFHPELSGRWGAELLGRWVRRG